jgi:dephospho-CoA kinase
MNDGAPARGRRRPFVIGVTGDIACGKSMVMRLLGEHGAELIDADAVYHELIGPRSPLWQALRDRFGHGILGDDGAIDRRALGAIVFADPAALADLDRITHPAVIAAIGDRIEGTTASLIAVDAVKLVESGMASLCDAVWLVTCEGEQQIERLMTRNGLSRGDAERRVAAQPGTEAKRGHVDAIIDNSGSIEQSRRQVADALAKLPI